MLGSILRNVALERNHPIFSYLVVVMNRLYKSYEYWKVEVVSQSYG